MADFRVCAVGRPDVEPLAISARLRGQIVYFISAADQAGVPPLARDEYWIARQDAEQWLDGGVFQVISPLDGLNKTEIELSEEQETLLGWLIQQRVEHIRVTRAGDR